MNEHASALGKLAKGKPKHYTKQEIRKRTLRIQEWNERKPKKNKPLQMTIPEDKYKYVKYDT